MIEAKDYQRTYKIALLVSISCVLQIAESLIPHPIPWLRLGLANIMVLVALATLGFGPALEVAVLRTVLSSFIMGTFMSPAFILSLSGALISTLIMGTLYWLARIQKRFHLSIVGISVVGALSHNMVQLYLAYLILVRHKGIFVFFPWLSIGALVMGWVTGEVSANICRKIKEAEKQKIITDKAFQLSSSSFKLHYVAESSFLHRMPPQIKIIGLFILSLAALIVTNLWFYLWLGLFLVVIVLISQTPFDFLFLRIKKCICLVCASFLLPVFFNSGKHVLSNIVYFKITSEGLNSGFIFVFRIILLILASALLVRTTSPEELTLGLRKVLLPLRPLGISEERIAQTLSLSWIIIPAFWETAQKRIKEANFKTIKNLRNLIPFLSDLITRLYLEAGSGGSLNYR